MKKYVLGILVSEDYSNVIKIKENLFKVISTMNKDVEICQITDNYLYPIIKKFAKELGASYSEVLRSDEQFNINSHDNNKYKFGKEYNSKYFHIRNSNFLSHCDGIYGFISKSLDKKHSVYQILRIAKDKKMKLKVFD